LETPIEDRIGWCGWAGLSCLKRDDKFDHTVAQVKIRSSFIYLANAVNDLRGNWTVLGLILAPLVLAASLCLLPDAINIQNALVQKFEPGTRSIAFVPVQIPNVPQVAVETPTFSRWTTIPLHLVLFLLTFMVNLVVLTAVKRMQAGEQAGSPMEQAIEVYRRALPMVPSFFFVVLLQALATAIGFVLLVIPGLFAFIWLYFSQYALVFDGLRSWPALLHSRDVMRGRFSKVATRILVFLAVWSGYNSWVGGTFVVVSLLIGPIGLVTGRLGAAVFLIDLLAVAVAYVTTAFFLAAGARLYLDLNDLSRDRSALAEAVNLPTGPLTELSA
jgi:hypothetical protein